MNETYPMWINKYLAYKGYSTRRGADDLVKAGKVFLNGKRAAPTDKVNAGDSVTFSKSVKPKHYRYYAYYKPRGVETHASEKGNAKNKDIAGEISLQGIFPIGRLDKDSEGLIVLTDDGRITDRLLNPDRIHEKEYIVTAARHLRSSFKEKMERGVVIEGYRTKPCKVEIINDTMFSIVLTEGKKHQIRRMVVALFNEVRNIKRVRIMNIRLGKRPPGALRAIEGKELEVFLKSLGL